MKNTELSAVNTAMNQQLRILNSLKDLVKKSQEKNLQDDVTNAEITQLNDYIADMVLASTTAKKLAENMKGYLDAEKKAQEAAEEKTKKKAAAEKKEQEEAAAKDTENEDDDLDFLN